MSATRPLESEMSANDTELGGIHQFDGLYNDSVDVFRWQDINITLPARGSKSEKVLLAEVWGEARAGEALLIRLRTAVC